MTTATNAGFNSEWEEQAVYIRLNGHVLVRSIRFLIDYIHDWRPGVIMNWKLNADVQSSRDGTQAKRTLQYGNESDKARIYARRVPSFNAFMKHKVHTTLDKNIVISNTRQQRYENTVVNFVIRADTRSQAVGGERFQILFNGLTNGQRSAPMRNFLRGITELYYILGPRVSLFLSNLSAAISLTIDSWSSCNLDGSFRRGSTLSWRQYVESTICAAHHNWCGM